MAIATSKPPDVVLLISVKGVQRCCLIAASDFENVHASDLHAVKRYSETSSQCIRYTLFEAYKNIANSTNKAILLTKT